jgi:hypothetical protein
MELAEKRNSIPLPPISNEYGVRLPPLQYQLVTQEIDRQDRVRVCVCSCVLLSYAGGN